MRTGTAYFVSRAAAVRYYRPYDRPATLTEGVAAVDRRIAEGLIHIGRPDRPLGHRLVLIDDSTRYGVEEIPNNSNVRECDNCDNFARCVAVEMCRLGDLPAGESE